MHKTLAPAALALALPLLTSCTSPPPAPPTVDGAPRRPANTAMAVDLQVCRHALHNARLAGLEADRLASSAQASLALLASRHLPPASAAPAASAPVPANTVYTVHFESGSARAALPAAAVDALAAQARSAPLVVVRGRTDGRTDTPAEARLARARAWAVRDHLLAAGIEASRIRTTYQPAGDPIADNDTASGRAMNRRVEIEVYRAMPVIRPLTP
ncbi:MAG TPA: OmpA family protein [Roseateles sp.]